MNIKATDTKSRVQMSRLHYTGASRGALVQEPERQAGADRDQLQGSILAAENEGMPPRSDRAGLPYQGEHQPPVRNSSEGGLQTGAGGWIAKRDTP